MRIVETDNAVLQSDTRFVWCGLKLCETRDGTTNTVLKRYFDFGVEDNGTDYYFTKDHLGSIREVVDANADVVAQYAYDPWGRQSTLSGTYVADRGYTGHYSHGQSGLALAPFRAYDANLGRWISRDPIGEAGGINLYAYVGNGPGYLVDPTGEVAFALLAPALGPAGATFVELALAGAATVGLLKAIDAIRENWDQSIDEGSSDGDCGSIDLPVNPSDLLDRGYNETSHPEALKRGHRKFENPITGDKLSWDEGVQGAPGHRGTDHYHRPNPDSTGKGDKYLDKDGNPVPKGSDPSHLYP